MNPSRAIARTLLAIALALPLSLSACARGQDRVESSNGEAGSGGSGGAGEGGSGGATTGSGGSGWGGKPWDGEASCAEPTQFVYVVTTGSNIYRFWPPTLTFELVGHLDCPTQGDWTPMSMAIDQHAQAWVLYWDQVVYRVDLGSGECVESGYNSEHALPTPFGYFGMAFTADEASPEGESLMVRQAAFYDIGGDPGHRPLARLDTLTTTLSPVGNGLGGNADLAGTGDGRLFGFEKLPAESAESTESVGRLAEYDPATGERIAVTDLDGITIGDAWALAAWGGDVWLFTSPFGGSTSVVRYRPDTGAVEVVLPDAGFEVIGAGVSACAPIESPR